MAYMEIRVSGVAKVRSEGTRPNRIRHTFRNTQDGIPAKNAFTAELNLGDVSVKYDVRYKINGRWITSTQENKRAAETFLATVEGTGFDPALGCETFGAYATKWLADRDIQVRTRGLYQGCLDHHIYPTFKAVELSAITSTAVRRWHAAVAEGHLSTGRRCTCCYRAS